jgi:hypothetical protein
MTGLIVESTCGTREGGRAGIDRGCLSGEQFGGDEGEGGDVAPVVDDFDVGDARESVQVRADADDDRRVKGSDFGLDKARSNGGLRRRNRIIWRQI